MSLLSVRNLSAFYGTFQALFDVSLEADEGVGRGTGVPPCKTLQGDE